jgi:hypothetical protein
MRLVKNSRIQTSRWTINNVQKHNVCTSSIVTNLINIMNCLVERRHPSTLKMKAVDFFETLVNHLPDYTQC